MAGWSGLSAAARGAVLVGGAAVVAVAGYFGLRAPAPVAEVPSETAASGGGMGGIEPCARATEDTDRRQSTGHGHIYPKIVALTPDIAVP